MAPVVIGVGNPCRGDDAAGLLVVERLDAGSSGLRALRHTGDGVGLIEAWGDAETVILVDAVVSGAPPGTIHRLSDAGEVPRRWFAHSTHLFGIAEAIGLARVLGRLPARVLVFGIEGRTFKAGAPMTPKVAKAAEDLARELPARLAQMLRAC
ncbi:MAG TPA: hydrogenase maturation protease [Armatimonadota bacterium]|jgi:hydrogenase maturation protease